MGSLSDLVQAINRRATQMAWLARIVLWTEALLSAFWPSLTLVGAFLALALLGIPTFLPPLLHSALLIAFAGGLGWLSLTGKRAFRPPTSEAAFRRIERDSQLAHRPFATLTDRPTADADRAGMGLWRMHLERRLADVRRLRLAPPSAGLPERDPHALRLAVAILVILGFALAGSRSGSLILAALDPSFSPTASAIPVEAWIKPPPYTKLPPILLKLDDDKPVAVPIGSTIEAHVTGGTRVPRLVFGDVRQDFAKLAGAGFTATQILSTPGNISVRRGWSSLARWKITIIPDQPPAVAFAEPPGASKRGEIRLDYNATDDYGVASVSLRARMVPNNLHIVADPIDVPLATEQDEKTLKGSSFQDLTAHPWAGMKVLAKLVATDGAGQSGETNEIVVPLPERSFNQPTARAIIAARKQVILNETPWRRIAPTIATMTFKPELYHGDLTIFLALRTAAARLFESRSENPQVVAELEDLLWNAAIHIEEGDRPDAEKALKAAEDALEKALKNPNATASEIEQKAKDLQAAINRYAQALQKNQQQQAQTGDKTPSGKSENSKPVERKDLTDMVNQMKQMAQNGSRESAEQMLSNLKSMLQNMEAGGSQQQQQQQQNQKAQQALEELKELAEKQREMMKDEAKGKELAKKQEELRKELGDAVRDLDEAGGEIPKSLTKADEQMKDAAQALQQGKADAAKDNQGGAAGALDQAVQGLSGQLSAQGNDGQAYREGENGRDPFGRGQIDSQGVKVPTERQMSRAIEILEELRRRSSEHERPRYELDYLQRLLEEF